MVHVNPQKGHVIATEEEVRNGSHDGAMREELKSFQRNEVLKVGDVRVPARRRVMKTRRAPSRAGTADLQRTSLSVAQRERGRTTEAQAGLPLSTGLLRQSSAGRVGAHVSGNAASKPPPTRQGAAGRDADSPSKVTFQTRSATEESLGSHLKHPRRESKMRPSPPVVTGGTRDTSRQQTEQGAVRPLTPSENPNSPPPQSHAPTHPCCPKPTGYVPYPMPIPVPFPMTVSPGGPGSCHHPSSDHPACSQASWQPPWPSCAPWMFPGPWGGPVGMMNGAPACPTCGSPTKGHRGSADSDNVSIRSSLPGTRHSLVSGTRGEGGGWFPEFELNLNHERAVRIQSLWRGQMARREKMRALALLTVCYSVSMKMIFEVVDEESAGVFEDEMSMDRWMNRSVNWILEEAIEPLLLETARKAVCAEIAEKKILEPKRLREEQMRMERLTDPQAAAVTGVMEDVIEQQIRDVASECLGDYGWEAMWSERASRLLEEVVREEIGEVTGAVWAEFEEKAFAVRVCDLLIDELIVEIAERAMLEAARDAEQQKWQGDADNAGTLADLFLEERCVLECLFAAIGSRADGLQLRKAMRSGMQRMAAEVLMERCLQLPNYAESLHAQPPFSELHRMLTAEILCDVLSSALFRRAHGPKGEDDDPFRGIESVRGGVESPRTASPQKDRKTATFVLTKNMRPQTLHTLSARVASGLREQREQEQEQEKEKGGETLQLPSTNVLAASRRFSRMEDNIPLSLLPSARKHEKPQTPREPEECVFTQEPLKTNRGDDRPAESARGDPDSPSPHTAAGPSAASASGQTEGAGLEASRASPSLTHSQTGLRSASVSPAKTARSVTPGGGSKASVFKYMPKLEKR
uniref:Uncharacterized protein n=1 Tax=Chromera velia CCMP2878 TaxID=1169474 RepID=A0A0G4HCP7_9ALVE|eukprot:Cvel_26219.t1-p1 / transcript=Cvel_26219.t1 / gene=Cvel_26219 / organism=Chromera_velia_CCMP2878 / gene_product=hypothetical protein / transcript_product=hypothetical protein / location=Cvel_scaffold3090:3964-12067(+) / protein_length=863 / sequence_SO=supercontig / SO=protein_coding / is_pseudo=false